jgi:hypothetical protein
MNQIHAPFLPFKIHFSITTHLLLRLLSSFVYEICQPFMKVFCSPPPICYKHRPYYHSWFNHSNNTGESTNHGNFHYIILSSLPLPNLSPARYVRRLCTYSRITSNPAFNVRDNFERSMSTHRKNRCRIICLT